jgi:predicted nucleic acid-binding protein
MGRAAAFRAPAADRAVSALIDTSILIDYLRGDPGAAEFLDSRRRRGVIHASEITRLEVLAGMRPSEEDATRSTLSALEWHPVDAAIAEQAGELGRQWLPSHHTIDAADLAIAATAIRTDCELFTGNIKHFPMFPGLRSPY